MKLCIKQRVFAFKDKFTVYDVTGADRYYVEGEVFSFGKRLHIHSLDGEELMSIRQEVWSLLPRYHIYQGAPKNGREVAQVVKEFAFFRQSYRVEGLGWNVEGDVFLHDYTITCQGTPIATVTKQWLSWGDVYEIDLAPYADEVTALAVVLVIDACLESNNNN